MTSLLHVLRHKDSIILATLSRQLVIVLSGSETVTGSRSPGKDARALVKWAPEVEFSHTLGWRAGGDPHPRCCSQCRAGTSLSSEGPLGARDTRDSCTYTLSGPRTSCNNCFAHILLNVMQSAKVFSRFVLELDPFGSWEKVNEGEGK